MTCIDKEGIEKVPRCWIPRLLTFEEALQLEDLNQVKDDLLFAQHCFKRLSGREYGVVYAGGFSRLHKNDTDFVDWCLLVSGAIYYRRCFATGVRAPIKKGELADALSGDALTTHDYLLKVASLHVAHSVNDLEIGCTTTHIAVDGDGAVHRGGLGRQLSGMGPFGSAGLEEIIQLVNAVIENVVKPKIKALEASVKEVLDAMSDDALASLPENYVPQRDKPRVDRPRNWPKRK